MSVGFRAFAYGQVRGPLNGVHPIAKVLGLFALTLLTSRSGAFPLIASAALAVAGLRLSGISPAAFAMDGAFLAWMALIILPARVLLPGDGRWIDPGLIPGALLSIARLALYFAHAQVFYTTTELSRLSDAISLAARRLKRKEDVDPGLFAGLALLSIPRVLSRSADALEAARSRGYRAFRAGFKPLVSLSACMVRSAVLEAFQRMDALEARSYTPLRTIRPGGWRLAETAYVALPIALLAFQAVLGYY